MMKRTTLFVMIALLLVVLFLSACGRERDILGSISAVPVSGVAVWGKIDLDPNEEMTQPIFLFGDDDHRLIEPCYLIYQGQHLVFYEVLQWNEEETDTFSTIGLAGSDDGIQWAEENNGVSVLFPSQDWEQGSVGAPSVIFYDNQFYMWYAGGNGNGIGLAMSDDGIEWEKYEDNPVMVPDQIWEGGDDHGVVGAPCVIYHNGRFMMYYSGGLLGGPVMARHVGRAIGYAQSLDGMSWLKVDRNSDTNEDGNDELKPIFKASQEWEGYDSETEMAGWVSSPHVRVDRPVDRDIYRMYYTGNLIGDPHYSNPSIGYAASFDPIHFEAARAGINPILGEVFPLSLPGLTDIMIYGEFTPSVAKLSDRYRMIFSQTDPMDASHGLALAEQPSGL